MVWQNTSEEEAYRAQLDKEPHTLEVLVDLKLHEKKKNQDRNKGSIKQQVKDCWYVVAHTFNSHTQEAEEEGTLN